MSDTHLHVAQHATPVVESPDPDLLVVSSVRVATGEVVLDRDDPSDPTVIVISIEGHIRDGAVSQQWALRPSDAHTLALQTAVALRLGNPGRR